MHPSNLHYSWDGLNEVLIVFVVLLSLNYVLYNYLDYELQGTVYIYYLEMQATLVIVYLFSHHFNLRYCNSYLLLFFYLTLPKPMKILMYTQTLDC